MKKLIMCKGLPASGKTTWAKDQVKKSHFKTKRINKDDLRAMIDCGEWSKQNEKHILDVRNNLIHSFLHQGLDVIVDDTNLAPKHLESLQLIAKNTGASFEVKDFTDVTLQECLKRDSERANSVGENVIKGMYNSFLRKKKDVAKYKAPAYNEDLPYCLILDIDGTIAHMDGRSPYDYPMVGTDTCDENVAEIVRRYARRDPNDFAPDTYIIIVTGRDDDCSEVTQQWLKDNRIPYDEFYMRDRNLVDAKGNKLDDTIIKKNIYEEMIKPRFNVRFVLDDRDRVVKMWREQGLKVLQVAYGDF